MKSRRADQEDGEVGHVLRPAQFSSPGSQPQLTMGRHFMAEVWSFTVTQTGIF